MSEFAVKDDLFDAQTLRAASAAVFGGADLFECIAIARRVHGDDLDSWHAEWHEAAQRSYGLGVTAEARGEGASARVAFLKACTYFRTAGLVFLETPVDPRLVDSCARQREAFRRAIPHLGVPVETVAIPFEGINLPGYYLRVDDRSVRRATVLLTGGYDGTVEESYFFNARAALDRGYNVLMFDGPGQGSVLIEQGVPLRADWEKVVAAAVDWLVSQSTVDPDRIALIGLSLGGHLAPRAASGEHRVAACISDSGFYDLFDSLVARVPAPLRGQVLDGNATVRKLLQGMIDSRLKKPTEGWSLRRGIYVHGVADVMDYFRVARDFSLKDRAEKITCPTLVVRAQSDEITPSAVELYDALTCPKEFIEFTADEGADQHCEVGARQLYYSRTFAWLDGILKPER